VQSFATSIASKNLNIPLQSAWQPSKEWGLWFLNNIMKLTPRRITSHAVSAKESEEHERFHNITLQRLAIMFHEGLKLKHVSGSDEFGMHYFSQAKWKWDKKGSKKVERYMKEDKRQFTGDFAHNAEGTIIATHVIMDGKTDRALPHGTIRKDPKFQYYLFSRTVNLWCDDTTKCAFMESVYSYHLRETAKDLGISLDETRKSRECRPLARLLAR
jgi:hypothetical protein